MILRLSYEPYQWIVSIYKLFLNIFSIVSNEQNLIFVLVLYVLYSRCSKLENKSITFFIGSDFWDNWNIRQFFCVCLSDYLMISIFFFKSNFLFVFQTSQPMAPSRRRKGPAAPPNARWNLKKKNIFQFSTEKIIFSFVLSNWLKSFFVCDLTAKNRLLIYSFLFCF